MNPSLQSLLSNFKLGEEGVKEGESGDMTSLRSLVNILTQISNLSTKSFFKIYHLRKMPLFHENFEKKVILCLKTLNLSD